MFYIVKVLTVALWLTLPSFGQQTVTVGTDSEDYRTIQEAVDAVGVGGCVRVSPGNYEGFVISKSVRVLGSVEAGSPAPSTLVFGPVVVGDLRGPGCVVLADIFAISDGVVQVVNCESPVVVFSCNIAGAYVEDSSNVAFVNSAISTAFLAEPRFALETKGSRVLLQDCGMNVSVSLPAAVCIDSSEVVSWRGGIGSVPKSNQLAGLLRNNSRFLWSDGFYGVCTRVPCVPLFDADDTSEARFLRAVETEMRVFQGSLSLGLEVAIPPSASYSFFAFSNPSGPSAVGQGESWLDPASLVLLGVEFSPLGANVGLEFPLVQLPERLGIPFFVQAGIVEMDGRVTFSSRGVVVF